jgi:hypothetical protein
MKVIVPVSSQNLPKVRTLIDVIHHLGPYGSNDSFVFLTTKGNHANVWPLISHIPQATAAVGLSGTVRRFPTSANEVFLESARYAAANFGPDQPWLYLTPESVPLKNQWLTHLERQYLSQSKPFLGVLDYLPQKITDAQGVVRINPGDPYTLEAAVYPSDLVKRITENLINLSTHHEQIRRRSTAPHTHETKLIFSAKWAENLSIAEVPEEAVILARVYDINSVARQVISGTPAPIPQPPPAPTPTPAPTPAPVEPIVVPISAPAGTTVEADGTVRLGGSRPAPTPPSEDASFEKAKAEHAILEESPQAVMVIAKTKKPRKASAPSHSPA